MTTTYKDNSYSWEDIGNIMKIAMFGHKRIPSREGGVEIVIEELGSRLVKLGHDVTCFNRAGHHVSGSAFDDKSYNEYKGIHLKKVISIDKKGLAAISSAFFSSILCAFGRFDVVHIHAEGPALFCFIPKFFGKRVIVTIHGLDHRRAKWGNLARNVILQGEKNAAKYADEIIVLSKDVQEYFFKNYGRKTYLIPNGVNIPKIVPAKIIKEKYGLDKNSYVLFLGRLVPEKGISYLLEAWKSIKTDKKLVIAGGSSDTESYVNELKTKISNNVIFTGFVQGELLAELFSNAYLYTLPSDLEGMPLSLLEAMSYKNCCLVSDIDECASVVESYGITFKKSNVTDLKNKLQYLLDSPLEIEWFKNNAQKYICNKYNWDEVVNKTLILYNCQTK